MARPLEDFEAIVRRAGLLTSRREEEQLTLHPLDARNIHPNLPAKVRTLFDDGYYAEATFEAYKYVDKIVQTLSSVNETGMKLMMKAFDEASPILKLTALSSASEIDEQKGFRFLFAGAVMAVRNPRGHEVNMQDDPDTCLDHLALASLLLRRLEQSGLL